MAENLSPDPGGKIIVVQMLTDDAGSVYTGDLTIRQSEFENALRTLPAEYQQYAMGPGKKQFAEDYLRMRMLAAEGVKAGLDKDPEVVRQLELMRENLVANAQLQKIEASVVVPESGGDLDVNFGLGKR